MANGGPKFLGGNMEKVEQSRDVIENLASDRTILVVPANENCNQNPDLVQCQTIRDVFSNFKPAKEVEVQTREGGTASHKLEFRRLKDFDADQVAEGVPALAEQAERTAALADFRMQLQKSPAWIRKLNDKSERRKLIECLEAALALLQGETSPSSGVSVEEEKR